MLKQFQISTRNSGRLRTIQVCIYDTLEELQKAGDAFQVRNGHEDRVGKNVHGLAQTFWKERQEGKRWIKSPEAGFIRLYRNALRTGIISHECTHMAVAIYQQDVGKTIPDMDREEKLCYLVGDLTAKLVNGLYKYNLIPEHGK